MNPINYAASLVGAFVLGFLTAIALEPHTPIIEESDWEFDDEMDDTGDDWVAYCKSN